MSRSRSRPFRRKAHAFPRPRQKTPAPRCTARSARNAARPATRPARSGPTSTANCRRCAPTKRSLQTSGLGTAPKVTRSSSHDLYDQTPRAPTGRLSLGPTSARALHQSPDGTRFTAARKNRSSHTGAKRSSNSPRLPSTPTNPTFSPKTTSFTSARSKATCACASAAPTSSHHESGSTSYSRWPTSSATRSTPASCVRPASRCRPTTASRPAFWKRSRRDENPPRMRRQRPTLRNLRRLGRRRDHLRSAPIFATEFHGTQLGNAALNSVRDLCEQDEDNTEGTELDVDSIPRPRSASTASSRAIR